MTIQNAPPGLDYDRDKKFSKRTFSCEQSFKEMVAMCLVKDQTKRPTAEKLLKHSCFKHTKPPELAVKSLFADLPPLWTRVKSLQAKDAAQLALKRMATADEEAISMSEYQRGVSAWNFDVKDLKTQASLPTVQPQTIKELSSQTMSPSLIIPQLQHIFQQNSVQQDLLMNLLNSVQPAETTDGSQSGKLPPLPRSETNGTVDSVPSERERMLLSSISELRAKLNDLTEELDSEKSRYNQLQQKLKAFTGRELV
ncbi:hypothetical protein F2Q70_00034995 [Brassica cretica]|uniref:Protein kinase domain-containing protein n=1 Tax=Brassica cretica TaxID=69181 RepID=A0A8S9JZQ2_BRACR|nr:hypothetical protein F2Q70_00034995 [Brassica cretica]